MSSQAFQGLEVQRFPMFGETVGLSVPGTASLVCRAADAASLKNIQICNVAESPEGEGNLMAGLAWAIALEAAAAFGVYGIWNFCQLLH